MALASGWRERFRAPGRLVAAGLTVWLPAIDIGGQPPRQAPLPAPVLELESRVLSEVPVPVGAQLGFFESELAGRTGSEARYELDWSVTEAEAWYAARLPRWGWTPRGAGEWERHDGNLRIATETDGSLTRLTLLQTGLEPQSAERPLEVDLTLPGAATRLRFDPRDLMAEELLVQASSHDVVERMSSLLVESGWTEDSRIRAAPAEILRVVADSDALLVAAWPRGDGEAGSVLSIGTARCMPPDGDGLQSSVYLKAVSVPAHLRLVGFDRDQSAEKATETRTGACVDLDLLEAQLVAVHASRASAGGLAVEPAVPVDRRRDVASAEVSLGFGDGGTPVTHSAALTTDYLLDLETSRGAADRRVPSGRSLLDDDFPVPERAEAWSLQTNVAGGWRQTEVHRVPLPDPPTAQSWYRSRLEAFGWSFERGDTTPTGDVFFAAGEEMVVSFTGDAGAVEVAASRRRICPTGTPSEPSGEPTDARWLLEVPVYPGATYEGFEDSLESYRVTCASLDLLASWYTANMSASNWALAGLEQPSMRRQLLFVRPDELSLPHEERSAWARIAVQRIWPYQYLIEMRRDPGGVRPSPWLHD